MTFESLQNGIKRLIEKRRTTANACELAQINAKLTKLYNLKYLMIEQQKQQQNAKF